MLFLNKSPSPTQSNPVQLSQCARGGDSLLPKHTLLPGPPTSKKTPATPFVIRHSSFRPRCALWPKICVSSVLRGRRSALWLKGRVKPSPTQSNRVKLSPTMRSRRRQPVAETYAPAGPSNIKENSRPPFVIRHSSFRPRCALWPKICCVHLWLKGRVQPSPTQSNRVKLSPTMRSRRRQPVANTYAPARPSNIKENSRHPICHSSFVILPSVCSVAKNLCFICVSSVSICGSNTGWSANGSVTIDKICVKNSLAPKR